VDYANTGGLDTTGVVLTASVPNGATFVSASGGGDHEFGQITWKIGDLDAGAGGNVAFTVGTDCSTTGDLAFADWSIQLRDDLGSWGQLTQGFDIAVDLISSDPITVAVSSVPASGPPLSGGTIVTHTIMLTNTVAEPRQGVYIAPQGGFSPGIELGNAMDFLRVVDAGGGVVDTSGGGVEWTVDLAASGSASLVFESKLVECIHPSVAQTQLNNGDAIEAFNECNVSTGNGSTSAAFAIQRNVGVELVGLGLRPPVTLSTPANVYTVQLIRPRSSVDYQVVVSSATGLAYPDAYVIIELDGLDIDSTPVIPPTEFGTVWNGAAGELRWEGEIPASGELFFTVRGVSNQCRASIRVRGGSQGDACSDIEFSGYVAAVPKPPRENHLVALAFGRQPNQVLTAELQTFTFVPGVDSELQPQLCLPSEFIKAIGVGDNGDVWVGPLPTYRYNPRNLELEGLDFDKVYHAGLYQVQDIMVDPNDDHVYFFGASDAVGAGGAAIRRYDPATKTVTSFVEEGSLFSFEKAAKGHVPGEIAAVALALGGTFTKLTHISAGGAVTPYDELDLAAPRAVTVDTDGDYITNQGWYSPPWPLLKVSPGGSGAGSAIVEDLSVMFSQEFDPFGSIAAHPENGDVYLAPNTGLYVVRRGPPVTGERVIDPDPIGFGGIADMEFVPEPGAVLLEVVALVALGLVRRRRATSGRE
jgi:hypothetical protein